MDGGSLRWRPRPLLMLLLALSPLRPKGWAGILLKLQRTWVGFLFPFLFDLRYFLSGRWRASTLGVRIFRLLRFALFARLHWRVFQTRGANGPSFLQELWEPFTDRVRREFHRVHDHLLDETAKYGKTWRVTPGNLYVVMFTADPACIRHILQDNFNNYTKDSQLLGALEEVLGNGIFQVSHGPLSADGGESWSTQRKLGARIFSRSNFRGLMRETFVRHSEALVQILEARQGVVDLQDLFFKLTLDSIGNLGLGVELDTLHQKEVPFATSFDQALRDSFYRFQSFPSLLVLMAMPRRVRPFFSFLPLEARIHKNVRKLDEFARDVIRQRRETSGGSYGRDDFLSLFLGSDKHFDDTLLRDVVMSFLIAGRDTTASTLSWLFYLLTQNPEIQSALQAEIDSKLEGRAPNWEDVSDHRMPLLNAVVWETLRLYPPVAADVKCAVKADTLPDGTVVPAGTEVIFLPYAVGRGPEFDDPNAFKPSRWIPFVQPSPYEFPVFQAGPRICLGMNMALFSAKVTTSLLLQSFSFASTGGSGAYKLGPTIALRDGLPVRLEPRSRCRAATA